MPPNDAALERALRKVVESAHTDGQADTLTVKSARAAAESELGLEAGYFKDHAT